MFCDAATVAYRRPGVNPDTGKAFKPWRYVPYSSDDALLRAYNECPAGSECLLLPCTKCMLCTGRYRRHWVLRCEHELRFHDRSCFVTLTVDDAHLDEVFPRLSWCRSDGVESDFEDCQVLEISSPWNSLQHKPFQDFMKRLRIFLSRSGFDRKLRYYMCGEYGDTSHRPHYHALLFGWSPDDALPLIHHPGLFVSLRLSRLWPFGFHTVAKIDSACISYVAGYVDKKMDANRMQWCDNNVAPEYVCMSRRPGLGGEFWNQFHDTDLYPEGIDGTIPRLYALLRSGGKVKMPKFYDDLLALHDPEKFDRVLASRQVAAAEAEFDLMDWLNESHRRCAVAVERRRQRETGAMSQVKPEVVDVA